MIFASTTATKFASDSSLLFKANLRVVMQALWVHAQWGKKEQVFAAVSHEGGDFSHMFLSFLPPSPEQEKH